jgi:hypothetical protein
MGARAGSMGFASSCLKDEWSLFNNTAGLADLEKAAISFTYDSQPSFRPFDRMAMAFSLPTKFGVGGAGIFRFGDDLFNEQIIALGFANTFGLASLGLNVNYIQYKAEGFGRKGVISLSFGGLAELTEKMFVGAHVINLNQPKISSTENEKLPTTLILGIGFQLTPKTFITTEVEKDFDYPVQWKGGLEYQPFKKFAFRTGFKINPHTAFLGVGFDNKKLKLDYAYQHNFVIGSRHQATVGYLINNKK